MHSPCIRDDGLLSAREYTAPIHSPDSHPNTSLLRARWTPARILRPSHIGRHIPGTQLLPQAVRGATSTRSACTMRVESPRRTAAHFFPHTRPPDTHSHLPQQHTTPPLDRAAVEYQGPLVNTYSSLVLSSMPGKRSSNRSRHQPGSAMMAQSRDDAASETSREGSGGLDSRRQDSDPIPFQAKSRPRLAKERVCCLLVLNLVSSTLSCIRRPRPRLLVLDVCGFV
jgi:hypothetical protein